MSRGEGTSSGVEPGVRASDVVLQRGAAGRWALVDGHGAKIEADAEAFVELEQ